LAELYWISIEDKDKLEDWLLILNKEKERAENTLMDKALMFNSLSDEVSK